MIKLKRPLWLFVPCVITIIGFIAYFSGIRYNTSDSLPYYIFRVVRLSSNDVISRNDYVAFDPTLISNDIIPIAIERQYITHRNLMIKRVAGIPGDNILLNNKEILINNIKESLIVLSSDSHGRFLNEYPTPITLDINSYWLISNPEGGFDSRYFGPVMRELFIYRAFPIF